MMLHYKHPEMQLHDRTSKHGIFHSGPNFVEALPQTNVIVTQCQLLWTRRPAKFCKSQETLFLAARKHQLSVRRSEESPKGQHRPMLVHTYILLFLDGIA